MTLRLFITALRADFTRDPGNALIPLFMVAFPLIAALLLEVTR